MPSYWYFDKFITNNEDLGLSLRVSEQILIYFECVYLTTSRSKGNERGFQVRLDYTCFCKDCDLSPPMSGSTVPLTEGSFGDHDLDKNAGKFDISQDSWRA